MDSVTVQALLCMMWDNTRILVLQGLEEWTNSTYSIPKENLKIY
jgi:hypothetical protein